MPTIESPSIFIARRNRFIGTQRATMCLSTIENLFRCTCNSTMHQHAGIVRILSAANRKKNEKEKRKTKSNRNKTHWLNGCICINVRCVCIGRECGWNSKWSVSVTNSYELRMFDMHSVQLDADFRFAFFFFFLCCCFAAHRMRCTWIFVINEKSWSLPFTAVECVIAHLVNNSASIRQERHRATQQTRETKRNQCRNITRFLLSQDDVLC